MSFIIHLLINAAIVFAIAYIMPQVHIKNYGSAIVVALLVGILNATLGFLIRLPFDIVTLGLLSFFTRLIVTAIIIKLVDKLVRGFEVKGFMPAIVIALAIAIGGSLIDTMFFD